METPNTEDEYIAPRIGSSFQADLPDLGSPYSTSRCQALWIPKKNDEKFKFDLTCLLVRMKNENVGEEDVLRAVLETNHDIEKVTLKKNSPNENDPHAFWTVEQIELFEDGLRENRKNFCAIRKKSFPNREVGDLVDFYYRWKTTPRYKAFKERRAAEKKNRFFGFDLHEPLVKDVSGP
ncbi:hypothetical protein QR680_004471 [Steinernema hermaphroditum]|uniref:SANT domain-containing protein n=1 Tax=Steinernema hermaphroditum TaxID=289476 RepID=A0AA39HNT2_9BILA|nr:hypothetical protein QR680_004471 [Steinernema hermaphroditum]